MTVLIKIKKIICVGLLISALSIPTSAFADTSSNSTTQYSIQSLINLSLTALGNQVGGSTSASGGQQVNFSDWWSTHSNECPADSYQIW